MQKTCYLPKKSLNIKKAKPFIKNPSRHVFYKFDQIFEKNIFFSFLTKNDTFLNFLAKNLKNQFFFDFELVYQAAEISGRKIFFPKIGQRVYLRAQKILEAHCKNLGKI